MTFTDLLSDDPAVAGAAWKERALETGKNRDDGRKSAFEVTCACGTRMLGSGGGLSCASCGESITDTEILRAHGLTAVPGAGRLHGIDRASM